jgi:uncharacterized protein (DUF433 family)
MITILGHGVYTLAEAAKLTKLDLSRIREWFRIRGSHPPPIFRSRYEEIEGETVISFLDLVDVFVAGQLRTRGVSLQTLRKVYKKLANDFGTKHPFSRKELLTDGKKVFVSDLGKQCNEEIREALSDQGVFPEIIRPALMCIDYHKITSLALRWHVSDQVVLDPALCFGQPIVEKVGIPTRLLFSAYQANDKNPQKVADWYNIKPSQVKAAVAFESSLAA